MQLKIIIDSRERNTELISALENRGIEAAIKTLAVGDYIISDRVGIERKTVSDFESSLMNGRMFEQLARLKEAYERPILLIEGSREDFRLKQNVVFGAIISMYIDDNLQVLLSEGIDDTADMLLSLAKHEQSGRTRMPSLKGGAHAYTDSEYQEYMVGNLPGVGPKLAKALLSHFGSIRNIASSDMEDLLKIDKIGKVKAKRILDILNVDYEDAKHRVVNQR
ncbi:MAG: helix-hairpin-helix domain-containing protein [Candidatus Marsarchaeota archaeon]|nr:helix-hairpin-helix domain-containing protein [Candidatus Marsarchaeota archaeon]